MALDPSITNTSNFHVFFTIFSIAFRWTQNKESTISSLVSDFVARLPTSLRFLYIPPRMGTPPSLDHRVPDPCCMWSLSHIYSMPPFLPNKLTKRFSPFKTSCLHFKEKQQFATISLAFPIIPPRFLLSPQTPT